MNESDNQHLLKRYDESSQINPEVHEILHRYAGVSAFDSSPKPTKKAKKFDRKVRALCLFCNLKTEINFLLALTAFMLSAGFLFAPGHNANYDSVYELFPAVTWATIFFVYACTKLTQCFIEVHKFIKYCAGSLGIWAWTFMFLSFSIFDSTPIAPAESLILVFAIAEAWVLLSVVNVCSSLERRSRQRSNNKN